MSDRLKPTNLFALDANTDHRDPTIIVIEAFVPLVLAVHGGFFLFWLGRAQPWQWLVLCGLLGLGLLRLGRGYAIVPLPAAGYATYIFLAAGLLIASTGVAASPFALWTAVLVAVYPLVLRTLHAWLLPPLVATGYLLLSLLEQQPSLPFVIICSRAFMLCFIGWLTCLLGISLQRRTQSYWQAAEQLAKEQRLLRVQTDFNQTVLDSLSAHIAVLDQAGTIIAVNQAWRRFADWNGGTPAETGVGVNYLAVCANATEDSAAEAATVAARIQDVIAGRMDHFSLEYPCHSPSEQHWFLFNVVARLDGEGAVVSHTNITKRKAAEAAVRQSEARNRALVEAIPDAILRIHRDGTYLDMKASQNFAMVRPMGELIGKKQHEVLPPAVADRVIDYNLRALATGELQTFDYTLTLNGEPRIREARVVPVEQDEVITIVRDVTDQRLMQDALRQSEMRNRALLEAIPDGMARLHRDGTYLDIKASPDFVPAHLVESLIGKKVQETIEPQLAQRLLTVAQQALDKGEIQLFEFEIQVGEGRKIREGRVVPAGTDEVICILRDITARKQAEKVLRQSEERYRTLAELSPDAILVNVDGRYVYANSAAARLFGVKDAQNLIGRSSFDFLVPEEYDLMHEQMRQIAGGKWPELLKEGRVRRLDGVVVHVEVAVAPFTWNDQPSVLIMVRDITARKQSEAEKSRLHAEVDQQNTHLRTLTVRLAEVQEEERKALARELHDQVGQNLSTLGLHLKIIQNQLAVAPPHAEPIPALLHDMQSLIKQTTEQVRNVMAELRPPMLDDYGLPAALEWYANRVAKQGNFTVQIEATEEMPRLPAAVENGLFRITQEAMINIMKHAQATVVMLKLAADGQVVALAIADNGRGIDPTVLATHRESWGLLSMRERTESLGGCFTLNSQPGQGTAIQIVIPYGHSQ